MDSEFRVIIRNVSVFFETSPRNPPQIEKPARKPAFFLFLFDGARQMPSREPS